MFDAETVKLITSAPPLDDLSLEDLPQRLTEAFASIVAARVRLRKTVAGDIPDELRATMEEMRRIACAHEAFVSALPERDDRAAAAFVAGAAHHACLLAARLENNDVRLPSRIGVQGVAPEVSATLLFLIAEANADAAEMAKNIRVSGDDVIEDALLRAIAHLATGRLRSILQASLPAPEIVLVGEPGLQALRSLFYLLLRGVRALAARLLGPDAVFEFEVFDTGAVGLFERAADLCVQPIVGVFDDGPATYSVLPGPLHLATLLLAVARDLDAAAVVNVPPPTDLDGAKWSLVMQRIARRRPYLWRNHLQAIAAGYLEPGTSAAVSFPTGGGKSTLAELKVAATLLVGKKVVFLAPTLALVDQTARAMSESFPDARVRGERAEDLLFSDFEEALPEISVVTPERCLALMSFSPDGFVDIGLIVFDECHLLHPRDLGRSRRSIDAMLCLLNLTAVVPDADLLLLSAMMRNTAEMAGWLSELTSRPCLVLNLPWKPTRQVRGCVVYDAERIGALNDVLARERATATPKGNVPIALKRQMTAVPMGFFCLQQTWASSMREHYALLPLLDDPVELSTGKYERSGDWYLTPNSNQVSAKIAAAAAIQGLKTLVFTQTIPLCNSAVDHVTAANGRGDVRLTHDERLFYDDAALEAGGPEHLYLDVEPDGRLNAASACHHGLLLPVERQLHEALFRRRDGIGVLVATSTLAQGMNLPSDVVIIAGDSRFDPDAERLEQLEAHELLNAAGRAGRAGEGAHGFVLIAPSKVIDFDNAKSQINRHWQTLQTIFAQSDQCLDIDDPLVALLDQIHDAATPSAAAHYLLRRLPPPTGDDPDAAARQLLSRSLGAFRARCQSRAAWVASRVEAAVQRRREEADAAGLADWEETVAATTGTPVMIVRSLGEAIRLPPSDADLLGWRNWTMGWLTAHPAFVPQLIRTESLEGLLGTPYKRLADDAARGRYAMPLLSKLLEHWMAGATLAEIEAATGTPTDRLGKCSHAREFVLRLVPELAYICGLVAQVLSAQRGIRQDEGADAAPLPLAHLAKAVREGLDSVEKLALKHQRRGRLTRVGVHAEFEKISRYISDGSSSEDFATTLTRVSQAIDLFDLIG